MRMMRCYAKLIKFLLSCFLCGRFVLRHEIQHLHEANLRKFSKSARVPSVLWSPSTLATHPNKASRSQGELKENSRLQKCFKYLPPIWYGTLMHRLKTVLQSLQKSQRVRSELWDANHVAFDIRPEEQGHRLHSAKGVKCCSRSVTPLPCLSSPNAFTVSADGPEMYSKRSGKSDWHWRGKMMKNAVRTFLHAFLQSTSTIR